MRRLAPALLALLLFAGCAQKRHLGYIEIQQPETIQEYGRPKFSVQPGDELEILRSQTCRGGRGECWAVRDLLTGQVGFVPADRMRALHRVSEQSSSERRSIASDGTIVAPASEEAASADKAARLLARATAILERGGAREAVPLLTKADELSGGSCAECLTFLADAYRRSDRFDDAVATARRAIALEPPDSLLIEAYNQVALGCLRDGKAGPEQMAEAEQAYRSALALKVDLSVLRYNLARLLLRTKRTEEAGGLLRAIVTESPGAAVAWRARVLLRDPSCLDEDCAPDFSIRTLDGRETSLEALAGTVILLHFWGTRCRIMDSSRPSKPCPVDADELNRLARRMAKDPFFLVVVGDVPPDALASLAATHQLEAPLYSDEDARLARLLDVRPISAARVLIDHRGRLLSRTVIWRRDQMQVRVQLDAAIKRARKAAR